MLWKPEWFSGGYMAFIQTFSRFASLSAGADKCAKDFLDYSARRSYPAAFANKVSEALGEAIETQAWLDHAMD